MAKIFNIFAFMIAEVLAIALVYGFWQPVTDFIGAMTGGFQALASLIWVVCIIFGCIIGPIAVLFDENLEEQIRNVSGQ